MIKEFNDVRILLRECYKQACELKDEALKKIMRKAYRAFDQLQDDMS